ncbi:hypothetical protein CEXT_742491 [Caerostris extrusa]|uniref:Uncharacterized protein n=1 Tax=Caerostris extrusa TaxID=172846 RepID=A0AAV4WYC6_CAEEX|nr:hypothetical protein CEXT_742491 [Caerostris extrusa]
MPILAKGRPSTHTKPMRVPLRAFNQESGRAINNVHLAAKLSISGIFISTLTPGSTGLRGSSHFIGPVHWLAVQLGSAFFILGGQINDVDTGHRTTVPALKSGYGCGWMKMTVF